MIYTLWSLTTSQKYTIRAIYWILNKFQYTYGIQNPQNPH